MVELVDTHCHIHEALRPKAGDNQTRSLWAKVQDVDPAEIIERAEEAGVTRMICVGTDLEDSEFAVLFVADRPQVWASIGIHPHEAKHYANFIDMQKKLTSLVSREGVIAVGECGLDFYYGHSPKRDQEKILRFQIELARAHDLPLIFHVREAFADFWRIFDDYSGITGVIHSFSATDKELGQIIGRGLYVGLNGIMTFTKDSVQLAAAKAVPLDRLLLETDAPFLTPHPFRGKICEPKHVAVTAEFLAELRGESLQQLAAATTANANKLFKL
jgi:TatD DNase family protein